MEYPLPIATLWLAVAGPLCGKVQAMGGDVRIVAEFPDRAPVVLPVLSEDNPPRKPIRKRAHAHA